MLAPGGHGADLARHATSVPPAFTHRLRTHQQAEEHSNTPG